MDGSLTGSVLCVIELHSDTEGMRFCGAPEKETDSMSKIGDRRGKSHPPFHSLWIIPFCPGTAAAYFPAFL
jgi:hypothetical protein